MNPPHLLAVMASLMNDRQETPDFIVDDDNRILIFKEWQHYSFGDKNWIAASCEDLQTKLAFAVHPNFIKLLVRKKYKKY